MAHQYSQDDIQQILHLAISRQTHQQDDLSREQLLEIAEEMGITVQALDEAERLWLVRKEKLGLEQQFDQYRQQRFKQSGTTYLIVNGFLVALDLMAGGGLGFSLYSIVGWGLGLAMQARRTYGLQGEEYDSRFQKWRRNQAIKQSVNGLVNRILPTSP
jgi:hypothetical protein